jgi:hypothetical protein
MSGPYFVKPPEHLALKVDQRFCNSFFLRRSPLFFWRKTRDFSEFYHLSAIGGPGSLGGTERYYQVQKQAQLITVCSWIALVEPDCCKRYRMRTLGSISIPTIYAAIHDRAASV